MRKKTFYEKYIKRIQDLILSFIAIILLSPVFIITYFFVKKNFGSPVIYKQQRTGLNQKSFTIYKFRTMTDDIDHEGNLLPDEIRLTKFGKKLRSTSIDELPQLFNILKGDMAIVGPRPQMEEFLPLYSDEQLKRHEVRPGLTGLAQVNGRNDITWTRRFEHDLEYIENINFLNDWKLMFITAKKVLKKEGIDGQDSVTMERFDGSN